MTPTQYLELIVESNDGYLRMHDHGKDCRDCKVATVMRDVAQSMIRDNDYPDDVRECIRLHSDNVVHILEVRVLSEIEQREKV